MEILVKQKLNDGRVIAVLDGQVNGSSVVEAASDNDLELRLRADGWKTINGSHVLIGKTGRILGGAGNKFTGKVFGRPFNKGKKVLKLGAGQKGRKKEKSGTIKTAADAAKALDKAGIFTTEGVLKRFDKDLAIENTQHLLSLEKKFGLAKKTSIQIGYDVGRPNTVAYVDCRITNPTGQTLALMQDKFRKKSDLVARQRNERNAGYNMRCSDENLAKYSITHEYGHILQNVLIADAMRAKGWSERNEMVLASQKGYDFMLERTGSRERAQAAYLQPYHNIRRDVADGCRDEIIAIAKKQNKKFTLKANISKYGKKDSEEFFAEVFANSQLGEPNELGRAMNIWLEQKGLVMNG